MFLLKIGLFSIFTLLLLSCLSSFMLSAHWINDGVDRKDKFKDKVVYASLFKVGGPEGMVIRVVALLVFGPKGLAEGDLHSLSFGYS